MNQISNNQHTCLLQKQQTEKQIIITQTFKGFKLNNCVS